MAVNETIITGRKWRRLIDKAAGLWQRISYWTHSSDVEFDDGKDAETKVGAIDGITDSLASNSSRIAASAKAVNALSNNLKGFEPILDSTGKITGYKTSIGGADTVFPFSNIDHTIRVESYIIIWDASRTLVVQVFVDEALVIDNRTNVSNYVLRASAFTGNRTPVNSTGNIKLETLLSM